MLAASMTLVSIQWSEHHYISFKWHGPVKLEGISTEPSSWYRSNPPGHEPQHAPGGAQRLTHNSVLGLHSESQQLRILKCRRDTAAGTAASQKHSALQNASVCFLLGGVFRSAIDQTARWWARQNTNRAASWVMREGRAFLNLNHQGSSHSEWKRRTLCTFSEVFSNVLFLLATVKSLTTSAS